MLSHNQEAESDDCLLLLNSLSPPAQSKGMMLPTVGRSSHLNQYS